jgi:transposase
MNKQRKSYTPDEKVAIIRQHLLDGVAISELCDAQGLHPTLYYRWQKEFFEGGGAAFAKEADRQVSQLKQRLAAAEEQLTRKNEVLAEVMEEYVRCKKKTLGPTHGAVGEGRVARRGGRLRGRVV